MSVSIFGTFIVRHQAANQEAVPTHGGFMNSKNRSIRIMVTTLVVGLGLSFGAAPAVAAGPTPTPTGGYITKWCWQ